MAHNRRSEISIQDWFEIGKQIPQITHSTYHQRRTQRLRDDSDTASESSYTSSTSTNDGIAYARYYQQKEAEQALLPPSERNANRTEAISIEEQEALTSVSGNNSHCGENQNEEARQLYTRYNFKTLPPKPLTITPYREKIVRRIESFPVVIVQGSTGCGKTTQIPQYILDYHVQNGKHCNIIVTQPRRIAAMSIAKRVADERKWRIGDLIGYQVGLKLVTSPNTRLTYVTTGVLLQKLIKMKSLSEFTHVIIDEVHERDQETDFLLIVVRKLLRAVSRDTKVIIMSATFSADIYAEYFSYAVGNRLIPANIFEIKEKSYEVFEFWLDDLSDLGQLPKLDWMEPTFPIESVIIACKLIEWFDQIEAREQPYEGEFAEYRGSVLIFLPGIEEINTMHHQLVKKAASKKWWVLPLHSSITLEEQSRVFLHAEKFQRKIILSTNIAESSITVSDIVYVIDFCLTRNLVCDPLTNYSGLRLDWASKANCIQRKGRAGRVATGRVYRMIPKSFYEDSFSEYGIPEMKRCPLSRCVLLAKMLDMGDPKSILGLAIDPPDLANLGPTILNLLELGALSLKRNERGVIDLYDGEVTWIGKTIANLPIEVHFGRLIVLGHAFGCLEDCIIIAAGLSQRSIFSRPFSEPLKAYESKFAWADNSFSDCIAIRNVFKVWQKHKKANFFSGPGSVSEKKWAENNFVQWQRLREMQALVTELIQRLSKCSVHIPVHEEMKRSETEQVLLIKLILAGAFYPRFFTHYPLDEENIARELSGYDPLRSVVLTGLPLGQAHLYGFAIENLLEESCRSSLKIHFDKSSSKAYVEFIHSEVRDIASDDIRNKIPSSVYLAIKMRLLRLPLEIKLLSANEATRLVDSISKQVDENDKRFKSIWTYSHHLLKQVPLPPLYVTVIPFQASEVIDCGHFWAHYSDTDALNEDKRIRRLIQSNIERSDNPLTGPVTPGIICLAPLRRGDYARARIEFVSSRSVGVFYVDYGGTATVDRNALRQISDKSSDLLTIPMQAFECKLSCIRPSLSKNPSGSWSPEANHYFIKIVSERNLLGRVYSVTHDIVRLEVMYKSDKNQDLSLNEELKRKGFAESAEEDYLSKQNNALRAKEQVCSSYEDDYIGNLDLSQLLSTNELSSLTRSGRKVTLKGPHSPVELSFIGLTQDDQSHAVRIEQESVNSVALCIEPQDKHCRLLVASDVNVSQSRNTIVARSTTFMPNIHGLLSLICMAFAPQLEFRTDHKRKRLTGALCGLGYDEITGKPIFPNHDMEIMFDVAITEDDIHLANKVRIGISVLLGNEWESSTIFKVQTDLQNDLLNLVLKHREFIEPQRYPSAFRWNQIDPRYVLQRDMTAEDVKSMSLLPLLSGIALSTKTLSEELKENIKELHKLLHSNAIGINTYCQVCDTSIIGHKSLKRHLDSQSHRDKEFRLWNDDED